MLLQYWHGIKFKKRVVILFIILCLVVILFLFWLEQIAASDIKSKAVLFVDVRGCKQNGSCIYDETSTSNMIADDEIVVAVDSETGSSWTLGHLKRQPTAYADMYHGGHAYNSAL